MTAAESDRQVLVAEARQLQIAVFSDGRPQHIEVESLGQLVQEFPVPRINVAIEMLDVFPQVERRNGVLVVEDSATQGIEQDVGVVMRAHRLFCRGLETVRGCHDPGQAVRAALHGGRYVLRQRVGIAEFHAQRHYPRLRLLDVGDDLPPVRLPGGDLESCARVKGTTYTALVSFPGGLIIGTKRVELIGRQQYPVIVEPETKHGVRLERFRGLGTI